MGKYLLKWKQSTPDGGLEDKKKVFDSKCEMESFIDQKERDRAMADEALPDMNLKFRVKKKGKLDEVL